jgi:YD repeat-containing protein
MIFFVSNKFHRDTHQSDKTIVKKIVKKYPLKIMNHLSKVFTFSFATLFCSFGFSQKTFFMGDVTDKNYLKKYKIEQVALLEIKSSAKDLKKEPRAVIYQFDENGVLIEKRESETTVLVTEYKYNKKGYLEKTVTKTDGEKVVGESENQYDAQNRLKESASMQGDVKTSEKITWIDETTKQIERTVGKETIKFLAKYDAKNRLVDESFADGKSATWHYDSDGSLLMKRTKKYDEIQEVEQYVYDATKRLSRIENGIYTKTFSYNEKGLLETVKVEDDNGKVLSTERYEYVTNDK